MSVGEDSSSSVRAVIASVDLASIRRSAIRRFATGYRPCVLAILSEKKDHRTHGVHRIFYKNLIILLQYSF